MKLVDVQCQSCKRVIEDVLVEAPAVVNQEVTIEDPPNCQAGEQKCVHFRVILSVARHSKHSSWEVR